MVFSLQGGMAAGKTTAARYIQAHAPDVTVFFEDNSAAMAALRGQSLDKRCFEDFCTIQRAFIRQEIDRYAAARRCACALVDLGAEEIEFYTLNYPLAIGEAWPVEQALAGELAALRSCRADRILFLQAGAAALRRNKQADATRERGFFEFSTQHLLPLKQRWFAALPNVDFICVDSLTRQQLGTAVLAWLRAGGTPPPMDSGF